MCFNLFDFFSTPRKRRKSKRTLGRKSYRKGHKFEKKTDSFLAKLGYKVLRSTVHSKKRAEFDRVVADKHGRLFAVEIKATKQKVGAPVVKKFKKKVDKHKIFHGGIMVSEKGYAKTGEKEAKRQGVKALKYRKPRRKSSGDWF